MAYMGLAGNGTNIAGQLVTFVAGPGIGRRSGWELGEAMSLGRWRGLGANPQHAGGGGGRGILMAGQLVTSVGEPGLTRRRPGTHPEEALRVGTWPPPPPAPAPTLSEVLKVAAKQAFWAG